MKNGYFLLTLLYMAMGAITVSCNTMKKADLIVLNARIYTVDDQMNTAQAMAIKDGRILATGSQQGLLSLYSAKETLDLGGRTVFPGFIDSHCHFYKYASKVKSMAKLKGTHSLEEITGILKTHRSKFKADWLAGRGWDQNDWANTNFPEKEALDSLFPDIPVILVRVDGHAVFVNSLAIERSGITESNLLKKNEAVFKEGRFTGIFMESTADQFKSMISEAEGELLKRYLQEAEADCFANGLTSLGDAGLDAKAIKEIRTLQESNELKIRLYVMLESNVGNLVNYFSKGPVKTDRLNIRSVKLYADGALGSRGACLLRPYTDDPGNYGINLIDMNELRALCKKAMESGFQVNTHCIGDSANRTILKVYSEFLKGKNDLRWRIEHAQVVDPDDIKYFGDYSIIPAIQSTHATSDMYWAEKRLGAERLRNTYKYKALLQQNGWIANGTDFPIEDINPMFTFHAAVTRQDHQGYPPGGFNPEDKLSREEALRSITIWAAKACFEEGEKGSLEAGKFADFVVLDDDIMTCPIEKVPQVKVLYTYLNGERVYRAGSR